MSCLCDTTVKHTFGLLSNASTFYFFSCVNLLSIKGSDKLRPRHAYFSDKSAGRSHIYHACLPTACSLLVSIYPPNMAVVSSDPSWWPLIKSFRFYSYFVVASCAAVIYDWALAFGREYELIWGKLWSLPTLLYLGVRYLGVPYTVIFMLKSSDGFSDRYRVSEIADLLIQYNDGNSCNMMYSALTWMTVVVNAMLGGYHYHSVACNYQQSRKMLAFLVSILLAVTITCGVIAVIGNRYTVGKQLVLSGTYQCTYDYEGDAGLLDSLAWILYTVWEVLALCLAVWIAIKHFRALRNPLAAWTMGNCFSVLIKAHVAYLLVLWLFHASNSGFSLQGSGLISAGADVYAGLLEFVSIAQMFVLGPRLILSIREYEAKLTTNPDSGIDMLPIVFQESSNVSILGDV
ncbi:hypothetical protein BDR07DRAFT_851881 [Suillus spraguei]|nr:hypothetical protein BDR07DRAFT_851881 [Suillus spraguei]